MYTTPHSAMGAKLVSVDPLMQAAAGVGETTLDDLPEGDLGVCGGVGTGDRCRGVLTSSECMCINLSEPQTLLELKQLLTDVSGIATESVLVWTPNDEDALLSWVDSQTGLAMPSPSTPWTGGYITAGDLAQRTATGWAYPTGRAVLVMLSQTGCLRASDMGGCVKFPRLMQAVGRLHYTSAIRMLRIYPPPLGAVIQAVREPAQPGDPVQDAKRIQVELKERSLASLKTVGWGLMGVGLVVGAYAMSRRM